MAVPTTCSSTGRGPTASRRASPPIVIKASEFMAKSLLPIGLRRPRTDPSPIPDDNRGYAACFQTRTEALSPLHATVPPVSVDGTGWPYCRPAPRADTMQLVHIAAVDRISCSESALARHARLRAARSWMGALSILALVCSIPSAVSAQDGNVDPLSGNDWTPLHSAAGGYGNAHDFAGLLKRHLNDVAARDKNGWTPLHVAAALNDNAEVIALLTQSGADVSARDESGWTPLHVAAALNDSVNIIVALSEIGADVSARDEYGWTPLHLAAYHNSNPAIINELERAGAKPQLRNENGWTPLHMAAYGNGNPAVIAALTDAGAKLETRESSNGWTPLHLAAASEHPDVVTALLDAGADPSKLDDSGKTPWDYVRVNPVFKDTDAYWRLNDERFREN